MAGFTESVLQKKLDDLNETQQSIQTLSLWLIHHRKHYQLVVKTWSKEMAKGNELRKLTLMYLANDVIQNSKKKGPEYTKEFIPVLRKAFRIISNTKCTERTLQKLDRILHIWDERNVYDSKQVEEFKRIFHKQDITEPAAKKLRVAPTIQEKPERKKETNKDYRVTLSPVAPLNDPPEVEELVKALMDLENAASVDVAVREKIAKLPPEVSEVKLLSKLEDKEAALKLAEQVNAALDLLNDYNARLLQEMDERRRVSQMLRDYTLSQKQLLQQAEARLEEYKEKLIKVEQVRHEVLSHLTNLPDMMKLPDVTSGLAPLPSAGDLFT
ncbi:regulation of nuclear pre-mRNA domain-containing protein 1B [Cimex lectularius]|uniref:CID domain-containing protein n=1 Tax=Cimex lectularius TaxID=79782 RepID=A0A8I6RKT3_CIMLE|nr:regulation of nuclear pre-mRNA domain-containing protein 1B [Cimex lectularius]